MSFEAEAYAKRCTLFQKHVHIRDMSNLQNATVICDLYRKVLSLQVQDTSYCVRVPPLSTSKLRGVGGGMPKSGLSTRAQYGRLSEFADKEEEGIQNAKHFAAILNGSSQFAEMSYKNQ